MTTDEMDAVPRPDATLEQEQASLVTPEAPVESQGDGLDLSAERLTEHDPLFRLRRLTSISDGWIVVTVSLVLAVERALAPLLAGYPFDPLDPGQGPPLAWLPAVGIAGPVALLIYLQLPNVIARLFTTLKTNGTFGDARSGQATSYEDFCRHLVAWFDNRWWILLGLLVVVLYWLIRLLPRNEPAVMVTVFILIGYSLGAYVDTLVVVRIAILLLFTNRLLRQFHIRVNPLDPDGAGGLGLLRQMLMQSLVASGLTGVAVAAITTILITSDNQSLGLFVPPFATVTILSMLFPVILFNWLWLPQQVMTEARDTILKPLADDFQQAVTQISPAGTSDATAIKTQTDRLAALKQRYEFVRDVYPTSLIQTTLGKRLSALSAFLPLLTGLISLFAAMQKIGPPKP